MIIFYIRNDFYNSQYGFQILHSMELAALKLCNTVVLDLDKGEIPVAIFLDPSKAFDNLITVYCFLNLNIMVF